MNKIYYWSPCLEKVGTYKSTINSAISLARYSNNTLSVKLINVCGEWDSEKKIFDEHHIELIDLNFKYFKYLPKNGFFKSRISHLIIILFSIIPLIKLLNKDKPDILIIHLITSLPLFLKYIFNFKTEIILRISGFPKLNFFRKLIWSLTSKKIKKILCPTIGLLNQLKKIKIFQDNKLSYLPDPVISSEELILKRKPIYKKYIKNKSLNFISAGRLTRQKNYLYLIEEFCKFANTHSNTSLTIFGNGEEEKKIENKIKELNLEEKVFLKGRVDNIYHFMKSADAFILSSLWEDPGHVIIESAMNNLFIISSDCKNGPPEFLENGNAGILFSSNTKNALTKSLFDFIEMQDNDKLIKKIKAKKNCLNYSLYRHYKIFHKILN